MATIITREIGATAKGSMLTNEEMDNNLINLNEDKLETSIVGSGPNQVPTNADLGTLAFQDSDAASLLNPLLKGAVSFEDGTASLPSITNSDDPNTGIYFPNADTLAIATGGTQRLIIDSNGNVNISGKLAFTQNNLNNYVTWDSSTDTYETGYSGETEIHRGMRRCLLLDNGTVNYYLDPNNSNLKADGSDAVLTGADGQVMVEIPKFYIKKEKVSNKNYWYISSTPEIGYIVHPAFIKNGVEVNYRYFSAYDACLYDVSASQYISGLNLDNATSLIDINADILSSVAGVYPIVGLTRAECRTLAARRGAGWRQADFWLVSAIQMLYLLEFRNFNSQQFLGAGNTSGSYLASSSNQTDSPHTIAGASNLLGNNSTNIYSGAGVSAKPGTSFMSYRGIENFFGNCWNWVDGFNILSYVPWVSNNDSYFADDVSTNYIQLSNALATTSNYQTNLKDLNGAFLPSSVGGSSSTYITDYFYIAGGTCVAGFGGSANNGAIAGAFFWTCNNDSSSRSRKIGARLAF